MRDPRATVAPLRIQHLEDEVAALRPAGGRARESLSERR